MARWSTPPFTLRQLQYALAVAEYRSFRRAAEACAVAQPSLSAQVAQLEAVLGVKLFERLARGVVVTEPGAAVLARARRTLVDADDVVATAERTRDPLAASLRVGVIPTVAPYLLPELAPRLRRRFPRLTLFWIEEKTHAVVAAVRAGELDAGIVAVESEIGELAYARLGRDPFLLAAAPGHPLAKSRAPLRPDALAGETVLLLDDGHCFRDQALSVCHRAHADEASVRATSLSTLAQMAAGGAGVTLLPSLAVATENRARGLVVRAFGPRGPSRTLALAWRPTSPIVATLRELAAAMAEGLAKLEAAAAEA